MRAIHKNGNNKNREVIVMKGDESVETLLISSTRSSRGVIRGKEYLRPYMKVKPPRERIVPCCSRRHCERHVKVKYCHKKHTRRKRKVVTKVIAPIIEISDSDVADLYENISSTSSNTDCEEMDKLIDATRRRMKEWFHKQPTPILGASTPLHEQPELVSDESLHSIDTLILEKINEFPLLDDSFTDAYSPTRFSPIFIETENNNQIKAPYCVAVKGENRMSVM